MVSMMDILSGASPLISDVRQTDAGPYLKAAKKAAGAADAMVEFEVRVAGLRETHRRRPSLIARLDKAGFV